MVVVPNAESVPLTRKWANFKQKFCCTSPFLVIFLFSIVILGVILNVYDGFDNYDPYYEDDDDEPMQTIWSPLAQDDPVLIEYVRKRIELPPRRGAYALAGHYGKRDKFSPPVIIMSFIYKYLTQELQAGGFYVEVGLQHGLHESNSLRLDAIYKWKGLIVETNQEIYHTLRHTKRHARTGSFCISPRPYSMFKSENQTLPSEQDRVHFVDRIECFPLLTVLKALTKKKKTMEIDFLSLTTGGTELDIMQTLPEDIIIKLLYIDHRLIKNGYQDIHDYLESRQYTWVHGVKEDNKIVGSIFVHNFVFSRYF